jgi:ArsR family transcriptional regulator, arsenate/arsenite/antimonite-responsive transcriptional repressor
VIDSKLLEASATDERALQASSVLAAVADPVRWTVMRRLHEGPACVCELQEIVPIAGNLLSYHLRILRTAGLVSATPRGRWVDYALTDDAPDLLATALPTFSV